MQVFVKTLTMSRHTAANQHTALDAKEGGELQQRNQLPVLFLRQPPHAPPLRAPLQPACEGWGSGTATETRFYYRTSTSLSLSLNLVPPPPPLLRVAGSTPMRRLRRLRRRRQQQ
jgi:hypothetical protein